MAIGGVFLLLAMVLNLVSPWGLPLRAPALQELAPAVSRPPRNPSTAAGTSRQNPLEIQAAQLGVQLASYETVARMHADPKTEQELFVFLDARKVSEYERGHLVHAYQFDPYRPESGLNELLPVFQTAEVIIVYCSGGECEDSLLAAGLLIRAGIPADRIQVFGGGIKAWKSHKQTVEQGERGSGRLLQPDPSSL